PDAEELKTIRDKPGKRLSCVTRVEGEVSIRIEEDMGANKKARDWFISKIAITPGELAEYGIAVDIGTTTVQVSLTDLKNQKSWLIDSFLNPQRRYGHDIIARISAAAEKETAKQISSLVRGEIVSSIKRGLSLLDLEPAGIREIVFSGNTAMTYFLFGLDPAPLGVFPYTASHIDYENYTGNDIGFNLKNNADIYALPAASSYLGGDLVGGLALLDRLGYKEKTFFIDIGTNGEIFLRNKSDEIYATSCAMGPALEGMNISHGMTADEGAINHIQFDKNSGKLHFSIIGNTDPVGICGTGIIDAIALLLEKDLVQPTGAFNKKLLQEEIAAYSNIHYNAETKSIHLYEDIALSQKDIRNIQLAKGASLAAANILLKESGTDPDEIEQVIIAGAFGENLDINNFKKLAFIPEFKNASYHFLGNTSLKAAELACHDFSFRETAKTLRNSLRVIELSEHPAFNDLFLKSFDFFTPLKKKLV
ncbi:MAG: ATP-binding protein, partial [bacterium]|nr:ATP-binding protein [bacterium]